MDQSSSVVLPLNNSSSDHRTTIIQFLLNTSFTLLQYSEINEVGQPVELHQSTFADEDTEHLELFNCMQSFLRSFPASNFQILFSLPSSTLKNEYFIGRLVSLCFQMNTIGISFASIPVLSAFGCNVGDCLAFDFDRNNFSIQCITDFKPLPFSELCLSIDEKLYSTENQNALIEYLKSACFPLLSLMLFSGSSSVELDKRPFVCKNVLINFEFELKQSDEFNELLLRELDLFFCNSPLASDNQPQDFALVKIPSYFSSLKEKYSTAAWTGGCIYSTVCFSDAKTFISIEEYRSIGLHLKKKCFL